MDRAETIIHKVKSFTQTSFWLTPINLDVQREKFFESKTNNPQFSYPQLPEDELKVFIHRLENASLQGKKKQRMQNYIYSKKIEELSLKLRLFLAIGTEEFTQISKKYYRCNFLPVHLKQSGSDSLLPADSSPKEQLSPIQTAEKIREYLIQLGITDWEVKNTDLSDFYFRVQTHNKTILVGKSINWEYSSLDNTLAHEVDGHIIRSVNCHNQTDPLFRTPLPFYIKTEEGLASFLGDYLSDNAAASRKHHALKYMAGYLSLKSSFRQTFEYLCDNGFSKDLAFQRTFRLKRGLTDTSKPGLYAREAIYYEGMLEVKEYLDKGASFEKLFYGKIGIEDIDYTPKPEKLLLPVRIEQFLKNPKNATEPDSRQDL